MKKTFILTLIFIFSLSQTFVGVTVNALEPNQSFCNQLYSTDKNIFFCDDFESGDMLSTNKDGFSWSGNNKTSIVTQNPIDGPVSIYSNGKIYDIHSSTMPDGTLRNWSTKSGNKIR